MPSFAEATVSKLVLVYSFRLRYNQSMMKRDYDLIRAILLEFQQCPVPARGDTLALNPGNFEKEFPGLEGETLIDHIDQLTALKFLKVEPLYGDLNVLKMTWDGYDFLGASKVESVWKKAKQVAETFSLEIFTQILYEAAKSHASKQIAAAC